MVKYKNSAIAGIKDINFNKLLSFFSLINTVCPNLILLNH